MSLPTFTAGTEIKASEMNEAFATIFDMMYPVGSIYMSATLSTASAVNNALPGTWEVWGAGRVPVGVNTSDTDFNTSGKTGGSKTHSLNLGVNGATAIRNYADKTYVGRVSSAGSLWLSGSDVYAWSHNADAKSNTDLGYDGVSLYGRTETGNTMPPYVTCYMYKRVS